MDRQAIIERLLEHYEHPRHHGPLTDATLVQAGGIPECGDQVTIYLQLDPRGERIERVQFEGRGCTISQAAASLLAEYAQGASCQSLLTMDDAAMLELVGREVAQARPRCATLALHTLQTALHKVM
ncbi:MAG: iron-sulfur cluster assembly scaffold protein [Oscillochloridaceae bacterium umkhey_bin13]